MPEQLIVTTMMLTDAPVSVKADRKSTEARTHNMRSLSAQGYAKQACAVLCVG